MLNIKFKLSGIYIAVYTKYGKKAHPAMNSGQNNRSGFSPTNLLHF